MKLTLTRILLGLLVSLFFFSELFGQCNATVITYSNSNNGDSRVFKNQTTGGIQSYRNAYSACTNFTYSGFEKTYRLDVPSNGIIQISVVEKIAGDQDFYDIFLIDKVGVCQTAACLIGDVGNLTNYILEYPVVAGSYYVFVEKGLGSASTEPGFDIDLTFEKTTNITCTDADIITCGSTLSRSNVGGSLKKSSIYYDFSGNAIANAEGGASSVFPFYPTISGNYTIKVKPTNGKNLDLFLQLIGKTNDCPGRDSCKAWSNTMAAGVAEEITNIFLNAGEKYHVTVEGYMGDEGTFDLSITGPCGGCSYSNTTIALPFSVTGQDIGTVNNFSNHQVSQTCSFSNTTPEKVYKFVVPASTVYNNGAYISLRSTEPCRMFVYENSCTGYALISNSTKLSTLSGGTQDPTQQGIILKHFGPSSTYYLVVECSSGTLFDLDIQPYQEGIISCDSPTPIGCGQTVSNNTNMGVNAWSVYTDVYQQGTLCPPYVYSSKSVFNTGKEIYYRITPTSSGIYTFLLSGLSNDLNLFLGDVCYSTEILDWSANPDNLPESITRSLVAGTTYYLTVDGYDGSEGPFELKVVGPCLSVAFNKTDVSCFAQANGSVTAIVSGGVSPYTYQWSNGKTTATISGLSAGAYAVTVKDANAATATGSVSVLQPSAIALSVVAQTNINCAMPGGAATVSATGGVGVFSYLWSNGQTLPNATNLTQGANTVTVTDANNCKSTKIITITANTTPPTANASTNDSITCIKLTALLLGSSIPTTATYKWAGPGINAGNQNVQNPVVAAGGSYTVTVTNTANSCTAIKSLNVQWDTTRPKLIINSNSPVFVNDSLKLSCSGGSSYLWNGPGGYATTAQNPSRSPATEIMSGSYKVTVTGINGCKSSDSINVTVTTKLITSISSSDPDSAICTGTSIMLTANPSGLKYLWSTGDTTRALSRSQSSITKFYVTITNTALNLKNVDSVVIKVIPNNIVGAAVGTSTLCIGTTPADIKHGTTGANGIGSPTGLPAGLFASWANNLITISGIPSQQGMFSYSIPLTGGCGIVAAIGTITVIAKPNAGTLSGTQNLCVDGTSQFSTNGDKVGAWSSSSAAIAAVDNTGLVTGKGAGTATIVYAVTGSGSCANVSATRTVTVTAKSNAGTLSGTQNLCVDGTSQFSTNGDKVGAWSSSSAAIAAVDNTGLVTGKSSGTATIAYTVTGNGGCANVSATRTVTVTAKSNAGTLSGTQNLCVDGTSQFSSNGDIGGAWSSSSAAIAAVDNTGLVTGKSSGTATIAYTVTGNGGCANVSATRTVTVTAKPNAGTLSGTQNLCVDGTSQFSTNGDNVGAWSSSSAAIATVDNTGFVTGKGAGTAIVVYTVTGSGGCANVSATRTVTVTAKANPGTLQGNQAFCVDGTSQFGTNGDIGGAWSSSSAAIATVDNTGLVTGKGAGTATISYTVTGTGGCADATSTRTITVNPNPNAGILSGAQNICVGDTTGFIIQGGTATGTWSSSDKNIATVDQNGKVAGKAAGMAIVSYQVASSGGCPEAIASKNLTINPLPKITKISGDTVLYCGKSTTLFCDHQETGEVSYLWNNIIKSTSKEISVREPGSYQVTLTSGTSSCIDTKSVEVLDGGVDPAVPRDSIFQFVGKGQDGNAQTALYIFPKEGFCYQWLRKVAGKYDTLACLNNLNHQIYCETEPLYSVALAIWDCKNINCKDTITAIKRADQLGIGEATTYAIYPNPTASTLTLSVHNGLEGIYDLRLCDLFGRTALQQDRNLLQSEADFLIDLTALSAGSYFLRIADPKGGINMFKVIKVE